MTAARVAAGDDRAALAAAVGDVVRHRRAAVRLTVGDHPAEQTAQRGHGALDDARARELRLVHLAEVPPNRRRVIGAADAAGMNARPSFTDALRPCCVRGHRSGAIAAVASNAYGDGRCLALRYGFVPYSVNCKSGD